MAIKYAIEKFPVAFPSKTLSSVNGAYLFSLDHTDDLWNGAIVAKGDYVALDRYEATDATAIKAKVVDVAANGNFYVEIQEDAKATDALIVYNPPVIEEEYNKTFQLESNFYIPAEMVARAYAVREGDIWELSADSFEGTPTVGATVSAVTNKKWTIE